MPSRYKINAEDRKKIYAIADLHMRGTYHELYIQYGLVRQSNGNFICPSKEGHLKGTDTHASISIDNITGVGHCFACDFRFNFPKYWKAYVAGTPMDHNDGSYTSWLVDHLGLASIPNIHIDGVSAPMSDSDKSNIEAMKQGVHGLSELYDKLLAHYKQEHGGKDPVMSKTTNELIKKVEALPMDIIDRAVSNLLADTEMLEILKRDRNIGVDVIEKYRLGMAEFNYGKCFVFPYFDGAGALINIKAYQPWNKKYKWRYPILNRGAHPSPLVNFTHSKLYFFEGEPDTYCAISWGISGAVTLGAVTAIDIEQYFGSECKSLFDGKEIVICLDSDDAGVIRSRTLARALYGYAKQIKIINLNKSDINPYGLDPDRVEKDEDDKEKRVEKDFTDFLRKNGFDDIAISRFLQLESDTEVYVQNDDRVSDIEYHVTIQEARNSKYASPLGNIKLEIVASVSDVDYNAYQMPQKIIASCAKMVDPTYKGRGCSGCKLHKYPGFGMQTEVTLDITNDRSQETINDPIKIALTRHQMLGLIEVTEMQKEHNLKRFCGIPEACQSVNLMDACPKSLIRVRLGKDLREHSDSHQNSFAEVNMEGYMVEKDIVPNRSYRFTGVQTTTWNGQYAVMYIDDAIPISTSIELFKMDSKTCELLQTFQPNEDEDIHTHLLRRYNVFGNLSGITGRERMFLTNDLAFFSAKEIHNKTILPEVTRGWVEVLIAGDSRCGKSVVSKFLQDHYKIGDFIAGTSGVSVAGLIGGISYFKNTPKISWGKLPINDGGIVIIDEMSDMHINTLSELKDVRSRGVAQIDKIKSSSIPARVRKIFLSNERTYGESVKNFTYGIQMILDLCIKPSVLSRFDFVHYVKTKDVPPQSFASAYKSNFNEFTEYQCQKLIQWAYSRTPSDIMFEEGIEHYLNEQNIALTDQFHPSSQIINIEMRAKIIRMATALATMLFSIPPDGDYNKIYVTIEHAKYIVWMLIDEYTGENMNLDSYSDMIKRSEQLGDMRFMMNILKYVGIDAVMRYNEFTENDLASIFSDYLTRTLSRHKQLMMVDGMTDERMSTCETIHEAQKKFVGLLTARNCIKKARYGRFIKTEQFNKWLEDRAKKGEHAETSDILESVKDEQYTQVLQEISSFAQIDLKYRQRGAG